MTAVLRADASRGTTDGARLLSAVSTTDVNIALLHASSKKDSECVAVQKGGRQKSRIGVDVDRI